MSCEWNRELLTGWLDGELTSDERAEVEKHLPACKSCRRELEELRDLVGAVKSLPEHPAPASISEGVRKEISGSAGGGKVHSFPRRKWSWIESALSAAAVLFVAVNVVYISSLPRESVEPSTETADVPATIAMEPKRPPGGADSMNFASGGEKLDRNAKKSGGISDQSLRETQRFSGRSKSYRGLGSPRARFITVQSSDIPAFRAELEKSLRGQKISFVPGAGAWDESPFARKNCLLVELMPEQLADLQAKLGEGDDVIVMADGYTRFRQQSLMDRLVRQKEKRLAEEREGNQEKDERLALLPRDRSHDKEEPQIEKELQTTKNEPRSGSGKAPEEKSPSLENVPKGSGAENKRKGVEEKDGAEEEGKDLFKQGEKKSRRENQDTKKIQVILYFVEKK